MDDLEGTCPDINPSKVVATCSPSVNTGTQETITVLAADAVIIQAAGTASSKATDATANAEASTTQEARREVPEMFSRKNLMSVVASWFYSMTMTLGLLMSACTVERN